MFTNPFKAFGLPVACGSQRVNFQNFVNKLCLLQQNLVVITQVFFEV